MATPIGLFAGSLGENAAAAGLFSVALMAVHRIATTATAQSAASTYRDRSSRYLALRQIIAEPNRPMIQMTNALASGAATRWQGYVARLGLGMTRSRNQTRATKPVMGRST